MTIGSDIGRQDTTPNAAAADWVARLHTRAPESDSEAVWLAFEAWLNAGPDHRAAYDAAETLWLDLDRQAPALRRVLARTGSSRTAAPGVIAVRRRGAWAGAGVLAALAVMWVVLGPTTTRHAPSIAPTVFVTAKGERRVITLPDGSAITLNSDSRLALLYDSAHREATLAEGSEAAFRVTHDPRRPFTVHAGDRVLRDLGTEFDVLRYAGDLRVTVREGLVQVSPTAAAAGTVIVLPAGRRLDHHEGSHAYSVSEVAADDAFGWRNGRLIYRDEPLRAVAADLNRYFAEPIRVDGAASDLRFSGVLTIDQEKVTLDRLAALVPISASGQDGVIVLRKRTTQR